MTTISSITTEIDSLNQLIINFGIGGAILIIILALVIGIVLTKYTTKTIAKIQTENKKYLSKLDRKDNLKRDVYLELSVAINKCYMSATRVFDFNIPSSQLFSDSPEISNIFAKAQLILSPELLKALNLFNSVVGKLLISLSIKRTRLDILKFDTDLYFKAHQEDINQRNTYLEMMKEHTISGNQNQNRYALLQSWYDHFSKSEAENFERYDKLQIELLDKQLSLAEELFKALEEISKTIPNLVCLLRKELEFDINLAEYSKIFEDTQKATQENLQNLIKELQSMKDEHK